MVEVKKLSPDRWKDYRDLRLEALQNDPLAFGSSYEEEETITQDEQEIRIDNALFAPSNNKPIGMIVSVINNNIETKHIANIFGVYVQKEYRDPGVSKKLV